MKAMIFAAGLGTRLKDETTNQPKALIQIGGKTLLQYAIEKLIACGVTEIVVNVHHFSDQVKRFLSENDFGVPVLISDETDRLLDTGGGLKKAKTLLADPSPIIIYNVDILSDINVENVIKEHQKSGAMATVIVRKRETSRYLKFNKEKRLVGWINKRTGEKKVSLKEYFENAIEMAFSGIHVVSPEIFEFMPKEDRFSIIDLYLSLAKSHFIKGYFDESKLWMDVGKPDQLEKARKLFSN